MKGMMLHTVVLILRAVYAPLRGLLPLKDRVTIISRQSDSPSIDIRLLTDYLSLRYPDLDCIILTRKIGKGIVGKLSYIGHMFRQMVCIATSRAVLLDGYCISASVLRHKPQTKIIQMWHAITAIKRFGYQTIGRAGGHSADTARIMCMHRNYDYILSPGGRTEELFCEAFHAGPEQMVRMGLPRIDLLWDSEDKKAAIRREFEIPEDKTLLLYVPTFRKGSAVYLKDLICSIDPQKYVLAIRLHPLEETPVEVGRKEAGSLQIIADRSRSTEEWIQASDRVITDYSALALEAALTGKPLYFYVYDINEYERATGLNVDPRREMPGACAQNALQLADLLRRPYDFDELHRFCNRYITIDTDACTSRLGDFIYGIVKEIHQKVPDAPSETENPSERSSCRSETEKIQ